MILFECAPPFQWRPKYTTFGDFKRVMWGWFAITTFGGGINELLEGIGRAGYELYSKEGLPENRPLHSPQIL